MIKQSEQLDQLAAAMTKFQAAAVGAGKGGTAKEKRGQYEFKRSYTRLEDAWHSARKPLTDNGLSVTQWPSSPELGRVDVTTRIMHESGQWLEATLSLAVDTQARMNATQQYGSAITYACRYALLAALGLPPVDDDAIGAGQAKGSKPRAKKRAPRAAEKPVNAKNDMEALQGAETIGALKSLWESMYANKALYGYEEWNLLEETKNITKESLKSEAAAAARDAESGDLPDWAGGSND